MQLLEADPRLRSTCRVHTLARHVFQRYKCAHAHVNLNSLNAALPSQTILSLTPDGLIPGAFYTTASAGPPQLPTWPFGQV